nr:unnamed protein product [Callosobruchus chinensis]
MLLALTGTKKFDKILQYFPVREHSFLPCDRDFPIIKRALKKRYRIYNVHNLTEIIANGSRTQKFEVREVVIIEITNFKAWWPRFYKKNAGSLESRNLERTQKVHFNISKIHYFMTLRVLELLKLRGSSKVWWNIPLIFIRVEIISYFYRQHHVILRGKYQLNRKR